MGKTLDKSKGFGQVCGLPGAAFEQDGVLFDINGDEVGAEGDEPAPKNKGGRPPKVAVEPTADVPAELQAQIDANLQG